MKDEKTKKLERNIRTHANFRLGEYRGDLEVNSGISITTPGMADDLRSIINRFVAGRDIPVSQDPYFLGNLPDPNDMDPTEREMYRRQVHETIVAKQKEIEVLHQTSRDQQIADQQALIDQMKRKAENSISPEENK